MNDSGKRHLGPIAGGRVVRGLIARGLAAALAVAAWVAPAAAEQYTVRVLAGAPGYDIIPAYIAHDLGIWEKYGLKVDFSGGNYVRTAQMTQTGDYDVAYTSPANVIKTTAAGLPSSLVGMSSTNCTLVIVHPSVKDWSDLKGKRFGIVTKYDVFDMTLRKHILPRHGLKETDLQYVQVPMAEVATAILNGSVAGAIPFEPYGTFAVGQGAKLMLAAKDLTDKQALGSEMIKVGLAMTDKFMKAHPDLARRIVWAHLDATEILRTEKARAIEVLKKNNPKMDPALIEAGYDSCGWELKQPPQVWIDKLIDWMIEDKTIDRRLPYEQVVNTSFQEGYPGYPGWEKKQ